MQLSRTKQEQRACGYRGQSQYQRQAIVNISPIEADQAQNLVPPIVVKGGAIIQLQ